MNKYFRIFFCLSVTCLAVSCTTSQPTLYSWGNYQDKSYGYIKNNTEESLDDLIASYEQLLNKQNGIRKTVPPGIYADYGYLLVKRGRVEEGLLMMKKEVELYPESAAFMSRIIKRIEG